ncbi:NAD(P)H-dependent oxidoreductase [Spongorhabdus nitratireducens]
MKVLVIYAHPNPESFNASLHREVCDGLEKAGHELRDLDLYSENFEPRLSRGEREAYMDGGKLDGVEQHIEALQWAEALIFIYPTWWMGPPAILKGWLERVWLPGVVADFGAEGVKPKLTNIRKAMVITTQGSSWWRMTLIGNPPRKMFKLSLRACTRCRDIQWHALYSMDKIGNAERKRFLKRIRKVVLQF